MNVFEEVRGTAGMYFWTVWTYYTESGSIYQVAEKMSRQNHTARYWVRGIKSSVIYDTEWHVCYVRMVETRAYFKFDAVPVGHAKVGYYDSTKAIRTSDISKSIYRTGFDNFPSELGGGL